MSSRNEKVYLHASVAVYTRKNDPYEWGPGIRTCYIIHYIVKGSGFFVCDGKTYHLTEGQCFLIEPGSLVRYYPDKDDPWEYAWIEFYGNESKRILSHTSLSPKNPVSVPDKSGELGRYFKLAADNFSVKEAYGERRMIGYYNLIFAKLIELCPSQSQPREEDSLISKAKDEIESSYFRKEFNVNYLSKALSISRSALYRNFMSEHGISPAAYITNQRIERACDLLLTTRLSISSIANSVGFSDSMHFSKVFKKSRGRTPTAYREEAMKISSDVK